ncbi:DUF5813 family protein [Halostella litorea]|uniref:DUF5813 family protein n=1 Tax=Halostella litorea TaxID=2528831 RepID=UPI0010924AEC|nr:DUF5813 family protein [Halostella litorea]
MTDDVSAARDALASHGAFEERDDGFACTTTPFDVTVTVESAGEGRAGTFRVAERLPTLDAAVEGEGVGEAVENGWYETLALRLEDAYDVVQSPDTEPVAVERDGDAVLVELAVTAWNATQGADDVKALVDFVEGTYVQGIVPGYDYGEPVAQLRGRARKRGERAAEGGDRDGTPL